MSYKVSTIANFRKEAKKLINKYPSLKTELKELGDQLSNDPQKGIPLGNKCFKIRLSVASKGKGKSGGARLITHFYVDEDTVFLLSIYDKSKKDSISDSEIKALLKFIK